MENWLTKRMDVSPAKLALKTLQQSWTFAEVGERVAKQVTLLKDQGVEPNMRIAVFGFNSVAYYFQLLSLQQLNCEIVCLNPRLSLKELTFQLTDSAVDRLFYAPETPAESQAFFRKHVPSEPFSQEQAVLTCEAAPLPDQFSTDQVTTIMYTSGTTGQPKGVCQSFGNHFWSAMGSVLNLGLTTDDCWGCPVPLFHISGFSIMMRSFIYGIGMYLFEKYDVERVNQAIEKEAISIISVVPTMLQDLVETRKNAGIPYPAHLRHVLLGGAPSSYQLLEKAYEWSIPVIPSYGMTETASQVVAMPSLEAAVKELGSSGKPLPTVGLQILSEEGFPCASNEIGEIAIRSQSLTIGYLNNPAAYQQQLLANGYFRTGDLGYLSPNGFLYIVNRLSERFTSGGENVFPHEIEQILRQSLEVQDVVVVGKADAKWGAVPVAFVIVEPAFTKHVDSLRTVLMERVRQALAAYKVPKEIHFVAAFPRNATGKIMRQTLQLECEK